MGLNLYRLPSVYVESKIKGIIHIPSHCIKPIPDLVTITEKKTKKEYKAYRFICYTSKKHHILSLVKPE